MLKPDYFCCPFKNKLKNIFYEKCTITLFFLITKCQFQRGFHIFHVVFFLVCFCSFFMSSEVSTFFIGFMIWIDLKKVTIILIIPWTSLCSCYKWVKVYIHQAPIGMQAWSDWIYLPKTERFLTRKGQENQNISSMCGTTGRRNHFWI